MRLWAPKNRLQFTGAVVKSSAGYSFIELIVVVSIAGILAAAAVPAMGGWVADNRLTSLAKQTRGALQLARVEAISTSQRVRVELGTSTLISCIVDAADGSCEVSTDASGEAVSEGTLSVVPWDIRRLSMAWSRSAGEAVVFDPRGRLDSSTGEVVFTLCDKRGSEHGLQVSLSRVGRAVVSKLADNDGATCS